MARLLAVALALLASCGRGDPPFSERVTSPDEKERVRLTDWVPPEVASENAALLLYIAQYDPDGTVRYHAASNLGHTGDPRVLPFLREELSSPHRIDRLGAAQALASLELDEACELLAAAWVRGPDPEPDVEGAMSAGLGPRCAPFLIPYRDLYPERVEPELEKIPEHLRKWK